MYLRDLKATDRDRLEDLLRRVENFREEDVDVALELVDDRLQHGDRSTYAFLLAFDDEQERSLLGYACFGPTPMTEHTFDLYWVAVTPEQKGRGIGRQLCAAVEEAVRNRGGRRIRVETGTRPEYTGTIRFYLRIGYDTVGRIRDFYRDGDDLLTFVKRV